MFLITLVTFSACNKQVNVDEEKDVYDLDNYIIVGKPDGVWFEGFKDKSAVKHAIVPNGVTHIVSDVFDECPNLETIVFPDSISDLYFGISMCEKLYLIKIPSSVTLIRYEGISFCSNFSDIYFEGTKEQWNNISIRLWYQTAPKGYSVPNDESCPLNKYNVYCSDGQLYFKQD